MERELKWVLLFRERYSIDNYYRIIQKLTWCEADERYYHQKGTKYTEKFVSLKCSLSYAKLSCRRVCKDVGSTNIFTQHSLFRVVLFAW